MNFLISLLFIVLIGNATYAQDPDDESTQYVKVASSHPDAVVLDGTDFFEAEPICMLIQNQPVTVLDSTDGEYVMIRFKCEGKTMEGWVKKVILVPELRPNEPRRTEASAVENASIAAPGSVMPGLPDMDPRIEAKGTGRTTGHIADLTVTNKNDFPIVTSPQTCYIPSDGKYQSYVGRIPEGIVIPPNGTATVPVNGVCTDVHTPPVPAGTTMPPLDDWIPVGVSEDLNPPTTPGGPTNAVPVVLITNTPEPPFTPADIPNIIRSPGFKPGSDPDGDIIVTWPGTDTPIDGTFNPAEDPRTFARVIVDVLEEVEGAADIIQTDGSFPTPFTADPPREIESFVQQVIWVVAAYVTGEEYEKDDFADNVYNQFKDNTGTPVTSLPEEHKADLDAGIADFWNAFQAVGVEAKVISVESHGLDMTDPELAQLVQTRQSPACDCDTMTYTINHERLGIVSKIKSETVTKFSSSTSRTEVEIDSAEFVNGVRISVSDIKVKCKKCEETPCFPYRGEKTGVADERIDANKEKVYISKIEVTGGKKVKDSETVNDTGLAVEVKPDDKVGNFYLTFQIATTCMAAECQKKICIAKVSINVKRKDSK